MKNTFLDDNKAKQYGVYAGAAAVGTVALVPMSAQAQTTNASITEVSDTIGLLTTISGAIATVVIGAMGVRYAIKLVNRVAVKG